MKSLIIALIIIAVASAYITYPKKQLVTYADRADFASRYLTQVQLDSTRLIATVVKSGLNIPWEITWGPDNRIWFTGQSGTVNRLNPSTGEIVRLLTIPDVYYQKSMGLLGMAIHPDQASYPFVFLHYTYLLPDSVIRSKLVRYSCLKNALIDPVILLDNIPGKNYHNGSRVIISPDNKIIMTTGDAGNPKKAQDVKFLQGKILRLNLDGSVPSDNPVAQNYVWTSGHRNPQGLVWGNNGHLYSSEHGPSNDDEVNLIEKGKNYGWPDVMGFYDLPGEKGYNDSVKVTQPLKAWTPIIAPAGLDYYHHQAFPEWKNSLLLANLSGMSLRVLALNNTGDSVTGEKIFFHKLFGRIRDLCIAPDGSIYLTTSNRDWHPLSFPDNYDNYPRPFDDRIIKLEKGTAQSIQWADSLDRLKTTITAIAKSEIKAESKRNISNEPGALIFNKYCASCHRTDGKGVEGIFPPLTKNDWVEGEPARLIRIILSGLSEPITVNGKKYEQEMPPHMFLTDEEIANTLTYIRSSFGNRAKPILKEQVSKIRAGRK